MRTLSLALAMLTWSITTDAHAYTCTPAAVLPAGGNIPADHLRLLYYPATSIPFDVTSPDVSLPRLYRLEGTTKVNVPYETSYEGADAVWLTPTIEQPLGTQLVLETDETGCDQPLRAAYSITEKRPTLPKLGAAASVHRSSLLRSIDGGVVEAERVVDSCALEGRGQGKWLALLLLTLLTRRRTRA